MIALTFLGNCVKTLIKISNQASSGDKPVTLCQGRSQVSSGKIFELLASPTQVGSTNPNKICHGLSNNRHQSREGGEEDGKERNQAPTRQHLPSTDADPCTGSINQQNVAKPSDPRWVPPIRHNLKTHTIPTRDTSKPLGETPIPPRQRTKSAEMII